MLVYVDDVLHLVNNSQEDMLNLNQVCGLKEVFWPLDRYIGTNIDKVQLKDGITVWYMAFVEYLRGVTKNLYLILEGNRAALENFGNGHLPSPSSYKTELDVAVELYEEFTNRFHQLIGFLRWSILIGRIENITEVSCLSQHLCSLMKGKIRQ